MLDADAADNIIYSLQDQVIESQKFCEEQTWSPLYCPSGFKYTLSSLGSVSGTITK